MLGRWMGFYLYFGFVFSHVLKLVWPIGIDRGRLCIHYFAYGVCIRLWCVCVRFYDFMWDFCTSYWFFFASTVCSLISYSFRNGREKSVTLFDGMRRIWWRWRQSSMPIRFSFTQLQYFGSRAINFGYTVFFCLTRLLLFAQPMCEWMSACLRVCL